MSTVSLAALSLIVLFVLMFAGEWIAVTLGAVGLLGLYIVGGGVKYFAALSSIIYNNCTIFTYTAIPLFILMGEIMIHSGLSNYFYKSAAYWLQRMPGGLLQTNIISCGVFAAISGSSPATAAAIGSVAYPEMVAQKYDKSMIVGSLAGGGALGILIPPSVTMIVYGGITETSVDRLFIAGIGPGLLAIAIFMLYIGMMNALKPELFPPKPAKTPLSIKIKNSAGLLPFIVIIVIVLGGIYSGIATPTEAAALGVAASIVFSVIVKTFTWESFWLATKAAVKTTTMILAIVVGAQTFSYFLVVSGVSRAISSAILSLNLTRVSFMVLFAVLYIILGCLMDCASMFYLTIPLLMPIIESLGFNLIWFGVVSVILAEIGMLTPPVGLNLFVMHGVANKPETPTSFGDVVKGTFPYVFLYLAVIILLYAFPQVALFLPGQM